MLFVLQIMINSFSKRVWNDILVFHMSLRFLINFIVSSTGMLVYLKSIVNNISSVSKLYLSNETIRIFLNFEEYYS